MKIKVVVHTGTDEGSRVPGDIVDIRESDARLWIQKGWAIARPDLESKREEPEPKPEPEPEPDPPPEEEGEDSDNDEGDGDIETATHPGAPERALSRRGKHKKK